MFVDTLITVDMKGVADMKLFRLKTVLPENPTDRCDAACRDRGRRDRIHDEVARNAIRL
jgi:hypothetical protein